MGILNTDLDSLRGRWFRELPVFAPGWSYGDHFDYTVIAASTPWVLYTTAGTVLICASTDPYGQHGAKFTTTAIAGNDARLNTATTGLTVWRGKNNTSILDISFALQIDNVTDGEYFFGIVDSGIAALTVLPTTGRHAGFTLDISTSANWRRTTADGTTQSITTSSTAGTTAEQILRMVYSSGSIAFYVGSTLLGTNTANLPTEDRGYQIVLYAQSEGNIRNAYLDYWNMLIS